MSEGDRHLLGIVDGCLVSAARGTGTPCLVAPNDFIVLNSDLKFEAGGRA